MVRAEFLLEMWEQSQEDFLEEGLERLAYSTSCITEHSLLEPSCHL